MARYRDSVCRLCRKENAKLFLKAERCYSDKCAFERRSYPPGVHGRLRRPKLSEYRIQLREKQKVKSLYGLLERQFKIYFMKAVRSKGITGEKLLETLERRLDNVVYRLGFSRTRSEARQLVCHSHFTINDSKVNIPSYLVREGNVIGVKKKSRKLGVISDSLASADRKVMPAWLELDKKNFRGIVKSYPKREDITDPIQEQLIVEYYSR